MLFSSPNKASSMALPIMLYAGAYGLIRFLSYAFRADSFIQNVLSLTILGMFLWCYRSHRQAAWLLVVAELLLGGAGQFLQLQGIALRSLLLGLLALCLAVTYLTSKKSLDHIRRRPWLSLAGAAFIISITFSVAVGLVRHHAPAAIFRDTIPFLALLYVAPLYHLLNNDGGKKNLLSLVAGTSIASAIFSLLTLILFAYHAAVIQGPYYKWFRDVVGGKITDVGTGFFRVVTPDHLLLTPFILVLAAAMLHKKTDRRYLIALLATALIPFAINFSRTYILALIVAFPILLYKTKMVAWLKTGVLLALIGTSIFFLVNAAATRGQSIGLELAGLKFGGIAAPETELSAHTRAALLPAIYATIEETPLMGTGLGSTLVFTNPRTNARETTVHYDWGYLEILAEFGIIGTLLFASAFIFCVYRIVERVREKKEPAFVMGFLAGAASLFVMTVTAPAIYHLIGIAYLAASGIIVFHHTSYVRRYF